ncbi:transporter-like protein [Leptomonas pyrrhocoris]|uniref:Transporter-like protein n=1 Tax=Leptomonas pyrrhocoris TaxID=157538 RepID=A0A0N0E0C0_LEPPY|nr:transporter-like protein [Leptomonas pyrrhocoris]KPA86271.1 transporter-like protein [Leptomonas pyrrhocoris]|eukprot:XP_015664710.1 transporter-like protein [Leptomonas pyrrhocoris]
MARPKKDARAAKTDGAAAETSRPSSQKQRAPVKETPLPWGQLAILCVVLLTESICSTVLIPFTPKFVTFLQGWDAASAGYAAGFPVGLFMLGQVLSGKMWSSISDKIGRVIGINVGVLGCALCMFFFGLSGSIWTMCFWRFVHGLVAGCSIIAKTMINDLTDSTNRAKGLALVSLTWGIGTLFGPAVGGFFYDPQKRLGLSETGFLARYPAFLPSFVVALYNLFSVVISSLFLHESNKAARPLREVLPPTLVKLFGPLIKLLQPKLPCDEVVEVTVTSEEVHAAGPKTTPASPPPQPDTVVVNAEPAPPPPHQSFGFKQALTRPLLRRVLIISMLISCSDMAFAVIFPLWCAAPTLNGGLGLTPSSISVLVLVNSVPAVLANIVFARTIQIVGGPILLWEIAQVLYGILTCIMPFATSMTPAAGFYYTMVVGMVRKVVECWSFGLIMLIVSMTAPPGKVGMMFGIQQSTACMVRCAVPFIFAPVFARSISSGYVFPFNHYFTFLLCLIPLLISAYMSHFIYTPSEDGNEEEVEDVDSTEAVDEEAVSDARRSGMGSARGSVRSRYSFFGAVPGDAQERESLLVNSSFANLANSFATNIIPGMPQNTILAVPVGSTLQVTGENADATGLGERRGSADSRDASSQEGDEVDNDEEYSSPDAEMAEVAATTGGSGREREGRRMAQRGNHSEDEELPL